MYCPGVLHGCQQLVQPGSKRVANSRETVGSLLNSQETVGSELARVPRELSLGARQDVRQGCLQQDLLESRRLQTVRNCLLHLLSVLLYLL